MIDITAPEGPEFSKHPSHASRVDDRDQHILSEAALRNTLATGPFVPALATRAH
jgi:hypothetical protein